MKTFYSLLLLVCLVFSTDAQSDSKAPIPDNDTTAFKVIEASVTTISDSALLSNKDSLQKVLADSLFAKTAKTIFGIASFYSHNLEGTKTATGETFHHNYSTAASNNFKLNSWVRVTNLRNGACVIVRINDRMNPRMARKGRVVDLTYSAAKEIGLTKKAGLTKVKVEQVMKGTEQ